MGYNASEKDQVEAAKKQSQLNEALKLDVIRTVMGTIPGRKWIYDMLDRCHIYNTPFVHGAPDVTHFNCGEQNVGNQLLADVQNAAPDLYMQMIKEAKTSSS